MKQTRMSTKFANHFQKALLVITTSLGIVSCQWSPQPLVLVETTIGEIQHALVTRKTTCHEVVSTYLQRIESYDKSSGINAITVINPEALSRAEEVDRALVSNDPLPELFCTPIVVKDNFDTHDMITTGGSITLRESYPPDDALWCANYATREQ